ncbi:hypothetical protein [Achromobacter mucicolens]|uniref:hypothetical protein n=1 Tax=Achromobacter mucicolens TaxID=1389922 RepID=UPI0028AE5DE6|nr:hypothetical protein [Achromobacter mucicolens]
MKAAFRALVTSPMPYVLLFALFGAASIVTGVAILCGAGPAFIAAGVFLLSGAGFVMRGMSANG